MWAGLALLAGAEEDYVRPYLADALVVQTPVPHRLGREALGDDVGLPLGYHPLYQRHALRLGHVDAKAVLAGVEVGGKLAAVDAWYAVLEWGAGAQPVGAANGLDVDDVRAVVAQVLDGDWANAYPGEVQHAQALERHLRLCRGGACAGGRGRLGLRFESAQYLVVVLADQGRAPPDGHR